MGANTYICYYDPSDLSSIRDLDFVEYANVYHPDLVIHDVLKAKCDLQSPSGQQSYSDELPAPEPPSDASPTLYNVHVGLHANLEREADQLKEALVSALHLDPDTIKTEADHLTITGIPATTLRRVAHYDEVQSIDELAAPRPTNHIARGDLDFVDYPALDPSIDHTDYDADKIMVAVADTGFDLGSPPTPANQHPALAPRVKYILQANTNHASNADEWGHGTHVTGSVGGNHTSKVFGPIRGTAPAAEITFQALADTNGTLNTPKTNAFWQAPAAAPMNARIHSNSYAIGVGIDPANANRRIQRSYSEQGLAGVVDTFTRANDENLVVFAAANDGAVANVTDTGATIGDFASAKNCVTVGACECTKRFDIDPADRHYRYNDKGALTGNKANIAPFSSIGPTRSTLLGPLSNSRIKPDVIAPGTFIYSAKSRRVPLKWLSPGPVDYYGASPDALYGFMSGTSMATPLVSGCAAVLRKVLLKNTTPGARVPAALIKALLVNGTVDMHDSKQSRGPALKTAPDNVQGFGRVSITASLRNITDHVHCGYVPIAVPVVALTQGKATSYPIKIPRPPKDGWTIVLKATMCWNDVGGTTDLVNSLELKATQVQGTVTKIQYGNTQTDQPDTRNNVQKVIWKDIHAGTATLEVKCTGIRQPAVAPDQDYALAWSIDYMDPGISPEQIILFSALGVALAAIVAIIVVEHEHH